MNGYCQSVVEAELLGVPVIVTDCEVFKEIGIKDAENGFVLNFDLSNLDCEKIYKTKLKFKYEAPKHNWDKYLAKGKNTYFEEKEQRFLVEATYKYSAENIADKELTFQKGIWYIPKEGYKFIVDFERKEHLEKRQLVRTIKEIKTQEELEEVNKLLSLQEN